MLQALLYCTFTSVQPQTYVFYCCSTGRSKSLSVLLKASLNRRCVTCSLFPHRLSHWGNNKPTPLIFRPLPVTQICSTAICIRTEQTTTNKQLGFPNPCCEPRLKWHNGDLLCYLGPFCVVFCLFHSHFTEAAHKFIKWHHTILHSRTQSFRATSNQIPFASLFVIKEQRGYFSTHRFALKGQKLVIKHQFVHEQPPE